jgi:hypothetical protein
VGGGGGGSRTQEPAQPTGQRVLFVLTARAMCSTRARRQLASAVPARLVQEPGKRAAAGRWRSCRSAVVHAPAAGQAGQAGGAASERLCRWGDGTRGGEGDGGGGGGGGVGWGGGARGRGKRTRGRWDGRGTQEGQPSHACFAATEWLQEQPLQADTPLARLAGGPPARRSPTVCAGVPPCCAGHYTVPRTEDWRGCRAKGCTLGGEAKLRALGEQLKALRERRPDDKVTPPTILTRAL